MSWEDDDARKTEDGELQFPPRPIVPKKNTLEDNPDEIMAQKSPTAEDIQLSYALRSKLESFLGSVLICHTNTKKALECTTCGPRIQKMNMIVEQIKAELTPMYDLKSSMARFQNENAILKTYIDTNEGPETANTIIRKSQMRLT